MSVGMGSVVWFGIQPKPIPKIKLSEFADVATASNSFQIRMRQDMKAWSVLFLGVEEGVEIQQEIVTHFVSTNQEPSWKYDVVLVDSRLPIFMGLAGVESFELGKEKERLLRGVRAAIERDLRLLIIGFSADASQLIPQSLANEINASLVDSQDSQIRPVVSVVFSEFPRSRDQEANLRIPCVTSPSSPNYSYSGLSCMALQRARLHYRKRLTAGSWVGLLDQVGATDYLWLWTREPKL